VLKFLRKYQKAMLVVFCIALMVAFLVPQAAQQFSPNRASRTIATTYDGENEITNEDLQNAAANLSTMRSLRFDPLPIPGLALLPNTGRDVKDAMTWILIQHAAEHNNLGSSRVEQFNFIARLMDVTDEEGLEAVVAEMNTNKETLYYLADQFLKAEQYRQLVTGIEYSYTAPPLTEDSGDQIVSPGLERQLAFQRVFQDMQQMGQMAFILTDPNLFQMVADSRGMTTQQLLETFLLQSPALASIVGHERVTPGQLRYTLQREFGELDLTVAVLEAEDLLESVSVDDSDIQDLFDRFADDAPGMGEPYGLGYQVPHQVKLQALRIPVDQVRRLAASQITPDQILDFYNAHPFDYPAPAVEGQPLSTQRPDHPSPAQRLDIRQTLIQIRTQELAVEIAQATRNLLVEQVRNVPKQDGYYAVPESFVPMPFEQVAQTINARYSTGEGDDAIVIELEQINADDWVSGEAILETMAFNSNVISRLPNSLVNMPNAQSGFLAPMPVPSIVLEGKAGLFSTYVAGMRSSQGQRMRLADYINASEPFLTEQDKAQAPVLQVGLPGEVLTDFSGSAYIFRITDTFKAHAATDIEPLREQLTEDAQRVAAYNQVLERAEHLRALDGEELEDAYAALIEEINANEEGASEVNTRSRISRALIGQFLSQPGMIDNLNLRVFDRAFSTADDLIFSGRFDEATPQERLFVIELPGEYRVAVVSITGHTPISSEMFQALTSQHAPYVMASMQAEPTAYENPMSVEALMRYTGFTWDDGADQEMLTGSTDEEAAAAEEGAGDGE